VEKFYEYLRGTVRIEVSGAQPERFISSMAERNLEFWLCGPCSGYSVRMTIYADELRAAQRLAAKNMCELRPLGSRGGKSILRALRRRRALALGLLAAAVLTAWSSLYIWDVDITGNKTVPDGEILRALDEAGVGTGTYWPAISSDTVRAKVLPELKDISWLTVNIRSSRAEVKVLERTRAPELVNAGEPTNVTAAKTGIIEKMSVLQGSPLLKPGDAVMEGETIVSGAMDSIAGVTRKTHAMADVQARTLYELTAVCPEKQRSKTRKQAAGARFALVIGEKRINFYRGSRNSRTDCDKIIKTIPFSIKGVFTLPVTLVEERFVKYSLTETDCQPQLRLRENLMTGLTAGFPPGGEVLESSYSQNVSGGLVTVTLRAECRENIGRTTLMTRGEQDSIDFSNLNPKEGKDQ
jgi:similar to stage IV sporulation protein